MVDEERVIRLLARIQADVEALHQIVTTNGVALGTAEVALAATKYRLITAIEGCARVAHHIVVAEAWSTPDSNAEAIAELGRRQVIESVLAGRLQQAVGLRNLLVHQYADIDDNRVVAHLDDLDDLDEFARQVARWLAN